MADEPEPKRYKVACNQCDTDTWHMVIASKEEEGEYPEIGLGYRLRHQIIQCQGCDSVGFRREYTDDSMFEEDDIDIYPPRLAGRKRLDRTHFLPSLVRTIYMETHNALIGNQPLLAAVGVRALVEGVCKQEGAKGHNLEQRIDDLVDKRILAPSGAVVLHKTRLLGNVAVHELQPSTPEVLGAAMDVVENLLQSVYILPRIADKLPTK